MADLEIFTAGGLTLIEGVEFRTRELNGGDQLDIGFPNGYGVSIVRHSFSYGGSAGLWELAVTEGISGELTYTTGITQDVIGWLEPNEAMEIAGRVSRLPNRLKELS